MKDHPGMNLLTEKGRAFVVKEINGYDGGWSVVDGICRDQEGNEATDAFAIDYLQLLTVQEADRRRRKSYPDANIPEW